MYLRTAPFNLIFKSKPKTTPVCSLSNQPDSVYSFATTLLADVQPFLNWSIPEGQSIISSQLADFLKLTAPNDLKKVQKRLSNGGFCFALSVCHGLMDIAGKLDWWEACLFTIAKWDGASVGLEKDIVLPGSEDKHPVKLRSLFERVLNYLLFFQVRVEGFFTPNDLGSRVATSLNYLEILINSRLIKAKDVSRVAGFFTPEKLSVFLNEELVKDSLCIISNTGHAIRIGFKDQQWIIYDPNYYHNTKLPFYKKVTKAELILELLSLLGNSLSIHTAHFSQTQAKNVIEQQFKKYYEQNPQEFLQQHGMHLIASDMHELMPDILEKAEKDETMFRAVEKAIHTPVEITESLSQSVARHCPQELDRIFKFARRAKKPEDFMSLVLDGLVKPHDNRLTRLHYLDDKYCAPALDKFNEFKVGPAMLSQTLTKQFHSLMQKEEESGQSALYYFSKLRKNNLGKLLDIVVKDPENGYKQIMLALGMTSATDGKTNLSLILQDNPDVEPTLRDIAQKALLDKSNPHKTSMAFIYLRSSIYFALFSFLFYSNYKNNNAIAALLSLITLTGGFLERNFAAKTKQEREKYNTVSAELTSLAKSKQTLFNQSAPLPQNKSLTPLLPLKTHRMVNTQRAASDNVHQRIP